VKSKYLSRRALTLSIALFAWLALCVTAAWWQVGRAAQGNSLSFLYSIEWPVFGVLGVLGWIALVNADTVSAHQEKARREYEEKMRAQAQAARARENEDPEMAAYNDHLAAIASQPKKKLWGH
jgi:DNA-binding transcriptional regulator of glucitol operon